VYSDYRLCMCSALQLTSSENVNNAIEELDGVQLVYNEKGYELLLSTVEWR
jgi:hypothetical protein